MAVQGLGVVVGAAGVDLLEHVGDHQAEGDVHLLVVGPGELHAQAPVLTALLMRSERVILFSGLEVIVLIPFRGELGLGSAQAEQVELVDADDDGDQATPRTGTLA